MPRQRAVLFNSSLGHQSRQGKTLKHPDALGSTVNTAVSHMETLNMFLLWPLEGSVFIGPSNYQAIMHHGLLVVPQTMKHLHRGEFM